MTETPIAPAPELFLCDVCGQTDTDPMIHVFGGTYQKDDRTAVSDPSFHYDCCPQTYRDMLDGPQHAVTVAAIAAAESGTKGDALREFIQAQPTDNNVDPEQVAPAPDPAPAETPAQTEGA